VGAGEKALRDAHGHVVRCAEVAQSHGGRARLGLGDDAEAGKKRAELANDRGGQRTRLLPVTASAR
jgi:hypothetical protein